MFNFFRNFWSRLWKSSVDTVEDAMDMTEKAMDTAVEYSGKAADAIGDTAKAAADMTGKAVSNAADAIGDTAKAAADMTGKAFDTAADAIDDTAKAAADMTSKAFDTAVEYTGKAAEAVGQGFQSIAASMINTSKFLTSAKYREEEGYPWIKSVIRDNWGKIKQELSESEEMLLVLWKYSQGKNISEQERTAAKEQLFDIIRVVPALGIFALPGGAILLPLLARALPWDLMPSAFREKVQEQYGEQALNTEIHPEEQIPLDKEAQAPEDLRQQLQEEVPELVETAQQLKQSGDIKQQQAAVAAGEVAEANKANEPQPTAGQKNPENQPETDEAR